MSGAFATPFVLRSKEPVAKLPKALSDSVASVASYAGATVMAAVEAGGDLAGKRVLVVGMGMQSMIACDVADQAGAKEVYASDPSSERRAWAKAIGGVTASVHLKDQSLGGSIDDVFGFLRINSGVKVAGNSLDIGEHAVITGSVADSENVGFNPETLVRNWHLRQAIKFLSHSNIFWDDVIS